MVASSGNVNFPTPSASQRDCLGSNYSGVLLVNTNKNIHQGASSFLYSKTLSHFDVLVGGSLTFEGAHFDHNVAALFTSLSEPSGKPVQGIGIYAAYNR